MLDIPQLQASWKLVASYGDQVPLFFYSNLFLEHPEVRDLFPIGMATQRDRLVNALGTVVSNVDDLGSVVPVLQQLGAEHRKFGALEGHYPAVGIALLHTLEHFVGDRWTPELEMSWAKAYEIVANVMIDAARDATTPAWWAGEVVAHERRTVDMAVLTVRPNLPLHYRPGQSISVEVPMRPRLWRQYTPANLPREDGTIELHVRAVDGGAVSGALVDAVQPGDVLRLGSPVGESLTLARDNDHDLVLIAGGTGVAPMKALVEQVAADGGGREVHLFWGVRTRWDLYDGEAMQALADQHPWFTYTPCLSEDLAAPSDIVHDLAGAAAVAAGPWPRSTFYVCGSPEMVRGTWELLGEADIPADLIRSEAFFVEETLP